jgi:hypothetical protein
VSIQTNTFTTFSAIGMREDLADVIYNISPTETPFMNSIGRTTADATLFEWQTDALASASTSNAQLQGDDLSGTADSVTATVRVGNRTQISRKTVVISGTEERVNKAGRKSELAYQLSKKSAELKRDMEAILTYNQAGATGNATTAPTTATMGAWVKTNTSKGAAGVDPTYTSGVPNLPRTDGTARSFTETILKTVLQSVFTAGGNPKLLMVAPAIKSEVSAFTGIATRYRDVNSKDQAQIIGAADVYVGDFSTVMVIPNRFQRSTDGWVLDPKYLATAYLRPFQTKPLATTGDAEKRMLIVEYGLKVNNEAAQGLCADLN